MRKDRSSYKDIRALQVLLICAGVIVLGCLLLNGVTWVRLQRSANGQTAALDTLAQYSAVLSTLQDVEIGTRGFVISGSDYHLEIFDSARARFTTEWEELVRLERLEGITDSDMRLIRETSDALIQYAMEIVLVRQRSGNEAAIRAFNEDRPRYAMTRVRKVFAERMRSVEILIRSRNLRAEEDFQAGLATSMAMGLLAVGVGTIALLLFKRVIKEIRRSERYALSMLKAEESRRQKDIFLAMMSHEIRTPLNAIIGFGQLAQRENLGDKGRRYVNSILEGGQSLLLLINDILDLSKLQAGRMDLKIEPTNVRELIGFLERLFQEGSSKKGIKFRTEIQEDLPAALLLDSVRLRQILMNLIGNAVKFTEEGEVAVSVTGKKTKSEVSTWSLNIEVQDTGPGIGEEDLEHIFEPFYQTRRPSAKDKGGTGLGLAVVNRFIELMGGSLDVKSELGKGTRFLIDLEDLEVSTQLAEVPKLDGGTADFNRLRPSKILAVDDNETNRELICEILAESHHQVRTAKDGEEAIRKVAEDRPDLILMDLRMPVKDGPTAARELKMETEYRLMPIIAVTAGSLPEGRELSLKGSTFDGTLRKPFTRQEMYHAISQFIGEEETTSVF